MKRFAAFLLAYHLQEAAEANLVLARQAELPILKSFGHLSEQQCLAWVKESLETFLHQLEKQTVLEDTKEALRQWRKDTLPLIASSGGAATELVQVHHVRKQLLLSFLNRFTTDVTEASAIAKELDWLFAQLEQFAFRWYVDRKEQEHGAVVEQLQEKNSELAAAREELQASEEQLVQANTTIANILQREKLALAEVNAQRSSLYTTFMQAPSLLCITRGRELVYELANPSYLEVFDLQQAVEGKRLDEVFPNPDPSIIAIHHRVMDTGIAYVGVELPVFSDWKKNGEPYTRYFTVRYAPLYEAGSISGIITFGYEVTQHVSARQELERNAFQLQELIQALNQKNLELSRINNDLDNFIYTASHDLKSPVSNLEGLIGVLSRRLSAKSDEAEKKLMELMEGSILQFKRTLADLIEITKAQKDLEEAEEAVSFAGLLSEVETDLQELMGQANAVIEADFQVDHLRFARGKLKSILYNLLSNALKYRSPDRVATIRLTTGQQDAYVVLSVEDNGLGMTAQQRAKLFTMFKRMHTHVEGTGIGLYIIKRLVENAGGRIEVESHLDAGSTFKVYLKS